MPKCLAPACPNQVVGALYCVEHKYKPGSSTNITPQPPDLEWGGGGGVGRSRGVEPPKTSTGGGCGESSDPKSDSE